MSDLDLSGRMGWARTDDGYTLFRQDDGSYTDGDLYFASGDDLIKNNPGVIFCASLIHGMGKPE